MTKTPHTETPSRAAAPTELWTWRDIAAFLHRGRTATFELLRSPAFPPPIELTGPGADRLWDALEVRDFAASRRGTAQHMTLGKLPSTEGGSLDEVVVKVRKRRTGPNLHKAA